MRVLVTGATGFVGRSVTMALLGDGHEVHGLVRDPASARGLREAGVSLHAGDMREPGTYVPLVGQVDAVVQAAQLSTAGRVTRAKARAVFAAEHTMTSALAQACLDQHKRLVYTGGCFDWGDHGEELITEQTPLSPSPMGQGHAREAAALQRLHDEQGLDVVRLNPGFVYGPGGLLKTAFIDRPELVELRARRRSRPGLRGRPDHGRSGVVLRSRGRRADPAAGPDQRGHRRDADHAGRHQPAVAGGPVRRPAAGRVARDLVPHRRHPRPRRPPLAASPPLVP